MTLKTTFRARYFDLKARYDQTQEDADVLLRDLKKQAPHLNLPKWGDIHLDNTQDLLRIKYNDGAGGVDYADYEWDEFEEHPEARKIRLANEAADRDARAKAKQEAEERKTLAELLAKYPDAK
jgi:hypothetical protein